jgi:hypothetical protein
MFHLVVIVDTEVKLTVKIAWFILGLYLGDANSRKDDATRILTI